MLTAKPGNSVSRLRYRKPIRWHNPRKCESSQKYFGPVALARAAGREDPCVEGSLQIRAAVFKPTRCPISNGKPRRERGFSAILAGDTRQTRAVSRFCLL